MRRRSGNPPRHTKEPGWYVRYKPSGHPADIGSSIATMTAPPLPPDEEARLAALASSGALDHPVEDLVEIARAAAIVADAPIALVTFVDADRAWVKASVGLEVDAIDRHSAFCAWAVYNAEVTIIADAASDVRFADNPLVAGEPAIRFYIGAPIVTPEGHALGAICAMDNRPRQTDADLARPMQALAARVSTFLAAQPVP